jgi:antitoxin component YwqK of YwqJK toxin-antitoxin module
MKQTILPILLLFQLSLQAQLYYKDIVGTHETNALMQLYRESRVRTVQLNAFDADGSRTDGFTVSQEISPDFSRLVTRTGADPETASVLVSLMDATGRVIATVDSSALVMNKTLYVYDAKGRVQTITSIASDTSRRMNETEVHKWEYDANGHPLRMQRVVNGQEVAELQFKLDDNGNVIEEQSFRKGVAGEKVYYYYNNRNLLTDIVRFNTKAGRLLPDYLFEYAPSGQVLQKITVPGNSSNYLIWRYQYNEQGLKIREAIFNKEKQLTGKIDYSYTFQP